VFVLADIVNVLASRERQRPGARHGFLRRGEGAGEGRSCPLTPLYRATCLVAVISNKVVYII